MTHIWIPDTAVCCPLCDQPFKKVRTFYNGQMVQAYVCRTDKIVTFSFDPAFNKWRDTDKTIPCPQCGTSMKWFARFMDGFFKSECPKCKATMLRDTDVKFTEDGKQIELEDYKENQPTEEHVDIPIDKLKMPEDMKKAVKKKVRERRKRDEQ